MPLSDSTHTPTLTVVVHRRVRGGLEQEFEAAMESFVRFALSCPGHKGIWILRPARGASPDYAVVDQFESMAARRAFTASPVYQEWMTKLGALSEEAPRIEERQGMAGWFAPPETRRALRPRTWKMAVASFLGVYPLTA
ncbi:MAG: antibiotic biosynthesis monooxygenase [Verrucomicrobia bacterium]|nr:antibiotic biosynthesis monooxygenase [Verrucomicrobiota bacterium]